MKPFLFRLFLLSITFHFSTAFAGFRWIDEKQIFMGYEATFQDQEMADNDHPMEMETPHKREKFELLKKNLVREFESPIWEEAHYPGSFKPGSYIKLANGIKFSMTMEPACIEVNLTPQLGQDMKTAWEPVYRAAAKAKLVPYVYATGSASGGGQFHIGGTSIAENPFMKHPLLLRNLLVYFNQHPALLHGFYEGYDIGLDSSALDFHSLENGRENPFHISFREAIAKFDIWYSGNQTEPSGKETYLALTGYFKEKRLGFTHDFFINLTNLANGLSGDNDKNTIELRPIRPMPSAAHAQEFADFLLKMLDYLAQPHFRVENRSFTLQQSRNMLSRIKIEADWKNVKSDIGLRSKLLDEMVLEYTRAPFLTERIENNARIRESYSQINRPNKNIEMLVPVEDTERAPTFLKYQGKAIPAEIVTLNQKTWALALIPLDRLQDYAGYNPLEHNGFQNIPQTRLILCRDLF